MISQSDNRISRQQNLDNMTLTQASVAIANASKKDSSAMKTLAVVSTVFLPGTFISVSLSGKVHLCAYQLLTKFRRCSQ